MTSLPRPRTATYDDYLALPDDQKAELIDGTLYLMSGPKGRHIRVVSTLGGILSYRFGLREGPRGDDPGGWWILHEPELHLLLDTRVVRPDLAGWRRQRMPAPPGDSHKFTLIPDWVCEVLSPSTSSHDTIVKMPRYLEAGVKWAWIIDPVAERLDIFRAGDGEWLEAGSHQGAGAARLEPFDAVELDLAARLHLQRGHRRRWRGALHAGLC
ncbi:MAG: Uma2 family endonuclease [Deltaproteobacteria bacterium]|nr:Uma2 family endonuclease [Deltaproteobacteria bacterium]